MQHLSPLIQKTASMSSPGSVRVVWVASSAVHTSQPGGFSFEDPNNLTGKQTQLSLYSQSKVGDVFLASEYARRMGKENIISVSINPGSLRTGIVRHMRSWVQTFLHYVMLYEPVNGAYTMLFAGLSPQVTLARNGQYLLPFGRFGNIGDDLTEALVDTDQGGNGGAKRFWEYCEAETLAHL
jgi:NAD(P)-dependent dehydrogenase (short-subunit alcohol dehydrogenase family)